MIVSGGLLLISQRSNDSIENCMIEDYSNFDISVSESENTLDSSLKTTDEEKAAIQSECIVISELYREIYQQAPKVPSQYFGAENDITQETIDEIENILIAAGYSVINSDSIYPEYLEHSDCVNAFWECVKQQTDAEVSFWGVSSTGGLYYRKFCFIDGKSYGIFAGADWKDDGKLELLYAEKREIFYWDMTYNADFIYRDLYLDRHWDAAHLLRLHPVDKPMYDLTMKYILPIGYHNVNLFLLDWSSDDYGNLCFNDLLDYLYRLKYPSDRFTFSSHGYDLHIENELVADAFAGLPVQEQSILILHFVLDLPDQEVGRLVGMSRSAVQRRRTKSLSELRIKLMALMPKGG